MPYERLDKSIYVSDSKRDFKASEQQYINLYYLLQVQQKFINEQLSKPTTSRKER